MLSVLLIALQVQVHGKHFTSSSRFMVSSWCSHAIFPLTVVVTLTTTAGSLAAQTRQTDAAPRYMREERGAASLTLSRGKRQRWYQLVLWYTIPNPQTVPETSLLVSGQKLAAREKPGGRCPEPSDAYAIQGALQ